MYVCMHTGASQCLRAFHKCQLVFSLSFAQYHLNTNRVALCQIKYECDNTVCYILYRDQCVRTEMIYAFYI